MLTNIKHELDKLLTKTNNRSLYMLIVLGTLLGFVGLMTFGDHIKVLSTQRVSLEERLAQYGGGLDETLWAKRAEDSRALAQQWDQLYWSGEVSGIINAQVQTHLETLCRKNTLQNIRVNVDPVVLELPSGQKALRFQLSSRSYDISYVINTLSDISKSQPILSVQDINLNVRPDNSGTLTLSGLAYIITEPAPTDQNAANLVTGS